MHTIKVVSIGFALLIACLIVGRWAGAGQPATIARAAKKAGLKAKSRAKIRKALRKAQR